jgi:hypothetical protein
MRSTIPRRRARSFRRRPVGGCSRDVAVGWTGTDPGAGIAAFEIESSENGGTVRAVDDEWRHERRLPRQGGQALRLPEPRDRPSRGNVQTALLAPSPEATVPDCSPYDVAVIGVKMPAKVKLLRTRPTAKRLAKIGIQNRGATPLVITDAESLAELVTLTAESLGSCSPATVTLHDGKPQKPLPIVLAPKKKLSVVFDVLFECVHDRESGKGHEDYRLEARRTRRPSAAPMRMRPTTSARAARPIPDRRPLPRRQDQGQGLRRQGQAGAGLRPC